MNSIMRRALQRRGFGCVDVDVGVEVDADADADADADGDGDGDGDGDVHVHVEIDVDVDAQLRDDMKRLSNIDERIFFTQTPRSWRHWPNRFRSIHPDPHVGAVPPNAYSTPRPNELMSGIKIDWTKAKSFILIEIKVGSGQSMHSLNESKIKGNITWIAANDSSASAHKRNQTGIDTYEVHCNALITTTRKKVNLSYGRAIAIASPLKRHIIRDKTWYRSDQ